MHSYDHEVEWGQQAEILSIVHGSNGISRADLTARTGLSRTALEARIRELTDRGLIDEITSGDSSGGRRPRLLVYRKDAGYLIDVDLGATSVDVAISNLNAEVLVHVSEPADVRHGPVPVLQQISGMIRSAVEQAGIDRSRVKGIGVGVPGPVEFLTGQPVSPPIMPGWHRFHVREFLENEYGVPVFVDNDVNIMALGERWAGIGRRAENFITVKIGTGIGCGIICHGLIYRGADGCAGDIGHMQVTDASLVCRCGNTGCLEAVAGGAALARIAEEAARSGTSPILADMLEQQGEVSASDLSVAVAKGDPVSVQIVRDAGENIGKALAGLVNFFNPELIVIGGGVADVGDLLLASIRQTIYRRSLPLATARLHIQRSLLRERAGIVGASAMLLTELYHLQTVDVGLRQVTRPDAYSPAAQLRTTGGAISRG